MIELRGLHLGNIARSPAESVRPDLWPDHAWVPALGCTGSRVFDLCGNHAHLSSPGSLGWSYGGGIGHGIYTGPLDGTYKYPLPTGIVRSWRLPWTAVVVAAPWSSSTDCRAFGCWATAEQARGWTIWYDAGGSAPSWSMAFARKPSGTTCYRLIGNNTASGGEYKTTVAIGGWKGGQSPDQWFFRVDGKEITESFTSGGDPIYPGDTTAPVYSLGERSDYPFFGLTSANMLYWRALTVGQSLDLTADPLLPFRRRQPVYYSVPIGGGSTRSLIAALTGESATGTISAIIARALAGDVTATSITGAITASMARELLASLAGASATGDVAATLQRLLLASLGAASLTGDVTATMSGIVSLIAAINGQSATGAAAATQARALLADLQASSTTPDIAATLAALVALTATISGTTTTPAVAATIARALAANLAGQSTTGAIAVEFAGMLMLVASIAGSSTTGALTATTGRELRAAIAAASSTGTINGQLLRQIAATIAGASFTGAIAAELVSLVSLAASVVGVSVTPAILATLQRDLAAEVAAGSTTGEASATVARTLAAAVEAGSLTPDNLVLILTGLGILHDTTIISRTPRRGMTSRTVRRTLHSA